MYRAIPFLLLIFASVSVLAQKDFENGYFIDLEGKKTDCLISKKSWLRNPGSFTYKTELQGVNQRASTSTVREFVVGDATYLRFEVEIDTSSSNPDSLHIEIAVMS
jgi:hypothetical protein